MRLTFSFGRFVFLLCLAPSGLGLPPSLSLLLPFLVVLALGFFFFFFLFFFFLPLPGWLVSPAWPLAARWWLLPRPPSLLCPAVFVAPPWCLGVVFCFSFFFFFFFFFFPFSFLCAPPLFLAFSGFQPRMPWASALGCLLCWPAVSRLSVRLFLFRAFRRLSAAPAWLLPRPPPPPLLFLAVSVAAARCPLALPVALGPSALRRCVLRCSPALCALCCVCFVVARECVLLFAALLCAVCVPGRCAVRSLCSPLRAVLCFAVLVRSRCAVRVVRAVAGACGALLCVVLFPVVCRGAVLGLLARGCLLVACFGAGVPVWPRGLLPCGWCGLLWCPAFLCRVLWCCAVAWCCAAALCCHFAVLLGLALPFCGLSRCAVLCCWLAVLFFARWWCLRAVVLFPSCPGAVLPRGAVVSCPVALLGLFLAWVWLYLLEKPLLNFVYKKKKKKKKKKKFENKIKLYTTQHTRVQQDHVRCCALRATRCS